MHDKIPQSWLFIIRAPYKFGPHTVKIMAQ